MREITKYEAFDGRLFNNEQDCNDYEASHPFLNPKAIKFYSMNGKKIKDPDERVFIDNNRFIAYTKEGLTAYQDFCAHMGLKIPAEPRLPTPFPRHYIFEGNKWICIEGRINELEANRATYFLDEYEEDSDEQRHNLA